MVTVRIWVRRRANDERNVWNGWVTEYVCIDDSTRQMRLHDVREPLSGGAVLCQRLCKPVKSITRFQLFLAADVPRIRVLVRDIYNNRGKRSQRDVPRRLCRQCPTPREDFG